MPYLSHRPLSFFVCGLRKTWQAIIYSSVLTFLFSSAAFSQTDPFEFYVTGVTYSMQKDGLWKSPRAMVYHAKRKEIYICDTGNNRILIYNKDGGVEYVFKNYYGNQGEAIAFKEPHSIAVDENGSLYVSLDKKIVILDARGNLVKEITPEDVQESDLYPKGIHVDHQGMLYFLSKNMVFVMDKNFVLLKKFTKYASGDENLKAPEGITTDDEGNIYVTDTLSYYGVNVFSKDGYFLYGFGEHGIGADTVAFPSGIFVDAKEHVWLVDSIRQHVIVFTKKGKFLTSVGEGGRDAGNFLFPVALSPAEQSDSLKFYVLEREGLRLQLFEAKENPALKAKEASPPPLPETSVVSENNNAEKITAEVKKKPEIVKQKNELGNDKKEITAPKIPLKETNKGKSKQEVSSFATYIIGTNKKKVDFAYGSKNGKLPKDVFVWRGSKRVARLKVTDIRPYSSEGTIVEIIKGAKILSTDVITSYDTF